MSELRAFIRPFVALLCGWLFAYITTWDVFTRFSQNYGVVIPLLVLLLPPIFGVIAGLTVDKRSRFPIILAMLAGVLAVTGWYGNWLLAIIRADDALANSCHSATPSAACVHGRIGPDSHFHMTILVFYWMMGIVLVLMSSSITSFVVNSVHKLHSVNE